MIVVDAYRGRPVTDNRIEIVERKGKGHPDFICDAVMESVSVALCREYRKTFGTILHHNTDKGLLAAGQTKVTFGGGNVLKPMELIIGDRATFEAGGRIVPVAETATAAARDWIRKNLRFVDPDAHVAYRVVLAPGSEELTDIFSGQETSKVANDTSALVGYYPLSPTETLVLDLEHYLNSEDFKGRYPETGEDVKVMGLRTGKGLDLTVAMPLISGFIRTEREYFSRKKEVHRDMQRFIGQTGGFSRVSVHYNTLDQKGKGLGGVYLTLLGTSAEGGDSGQVGRGNRVNGLISVNRPMGTEAAAGKNPVSHVGKIYNILAHKMAEKIYKNVDEIREVSVLLLSRIGTPIDKPRMAAAQVLVSKGFHLRDVSPRVTMIMEEELSGIASFCEQLALGAFPVC